MTREQTIIQNASSKFGKKPTKANFFPTRKSTIFFIEKSINRFFD